MGGWYIRLHLLHNIIYNPEYLAPTAWAVILLRKAQPPYQGVICSKCGVAAIVMWVLPCLGRELRYSSLLPLTKISLVVIPAAAAADVLALHTEWALNISVFTPAFSSKVLSHLAIIEEHTDLWGFVTPTNRVVKFPHRGLVRSSYSFSVDTGQGRLSWV